MKKEIIQSLHDIRDSAQPLGKGELSKERKRLTKPEPPEMTLEERVARIEKHLGI